MFYTYAHYTPEGRLFYIGKGNGDRARSLDGRNIFWQRVVKKHGKPKVEVLANWDTEEEAFSHEMLLISCFKDMGYKLCNLTAGGEGSFGLTPWNKGKLWSDNVKRKQGIANIGNKYWVGKKHLPETVRKQELAKAKFKFIGTNIFTGEVITLIGKKYIKAAGFTPTHVYKCSQSLNKTHKKYTWRKVDIKDKP